MSQRQFGSRFWSLCRLALASGSLFTAAWGAVWTQDFAGGQHRATGAQPSHTSSAPAITPVARPLLVDVAQLVGLDFRYYSDAQPGRFFLPEIMGGGAAWIDYDGDGWQDLFMPNGNTLATPSQHLAHAGSLYRNAFGVQFSNVSATANLQDLGYGQGTCVGDINNDGFPDLLVTHYGPNRLWINRGDGTFFDATAVAGIRSSGWSTSAAFGDLDRDGDLDLYIAHYVKTSLETNPLCTYTNTKGQKVRGYCGPANYEGEQDELYANQGDGTFLDVAAAAGAVEPDGKGLAVTIADLNNDRWPDIYVANDMVRNFLFWNTGAKQAEHPSHSIRLKEDGLASGSAMTNQGRLGASMGIGCADYDRNGYLDLFITNYLDQGVNLYRNDSGMFTDHAAGAQVLLPSMTTLGFGTVFIDYDNDGWHDVFVTNGHVLGPLVGPPDRMRGQLYRNQGDGRMVEVTDRAGPYFYSEFFGRGVACADFTNLGAYGLAVVHQNEAAALLRNDTTNRGHFVGLQLVGSPSNRCALNARVVVSAGGEERVAEVVGGGSYLSENDHRLVIGLGTVERVERLAVFWPSGQTDYWQDLEADRYWLVREGFAPRRSEIGAKLGSGDR